MKSTMKNMLLSLTITACTMGAVLALVHSATEQPIARAATQARTDALRAVLPAFDNDPLANPQQTLLAGDTRPVTVFTATKEGKVCGYAVESFTDDGFSGEIAVMAGFSVDGTLTGYRVLSSAETPGLGAKADNWFRDPVGNRSVIGSTGMLAVTKDGGTVDAITAATITSRAFLDAINRARSAIETISSAKK